MKAVWTGTVFSSSPNASGAFGQSGGGALDGLPAEFVFLYDPDREGAFRLTNPGSFYDESDGFFVSGAHDLSQGGVPGQPNRGSVSPILRATATINGVSRSILPSSGYVGVERSLNSLAHSAFGDAGSGGRGGSIRAFGEDVFVHACGEDGAYACLSELIFLDDPARFAANGLSSLSGSFEFTGPDAVSGLVRFDSVAISRATPAPVPLPASAALLATGLLGLGALARRTRGRA